MNDEDKITLVINKRMIRNSILCIVLCITMLCCVRAGYVMAMVGMVRISPTKSAQQLHPQEVLRDLERTCSEQFRAPSGERGLILIETFDGFMQLGTLEDLRRAQRHERVLYVFRPGEGQLVRYTGPEYQRGLDPDVSLWISFHDQPYG